MPDEYLFDMDHFALAEPGADIIAKVPPDVDARAAAGKETLLTIDGHKCGQYLSDSSFRISEGQ